MHTSVVVDASVWVSWLRIQDANHNASRIWMEQYTATSGFLMAPTLLLIEVAAAISRRTGQAIVSKEAVEKINAVGKTRLVPLDSTLVQAAIDVAADLGLRAGDATYVALARQLNIPLISWDNEQLQRAAGITLRRQLKSKTENQRAGTPEKRSEIASNLLD